MKLILTIVFASSITALYSQLEFYDCPLESKKEFVRNADLIPGSKLPERDAIYYKWKIDTGNSTVFKYTHNYSCDITYHEAVSAILIWAIPTNESSFEIQFNSIDSLPIPLVYSTSCGPPCRKYNFEIISGSGAIQGYLANNIWHIKGKIKMTLFNKSKNISASKELLINDEYVLWKQKRKDRKGYKFNGF